MAIRSWLVEQKHAGLIIAKVSGLLNGDVSDLLELPSWGDKTIQIDGTFGVGGSISVKGANEDEGATAANWFDLHKADDPTAVDPAGSFTAQAARVMASIIENSRYIKAFVTAGDGTTNLEVIVVAVTSR